MIKAIILDVDGVIIGTRQGVNFPYPGDKVLKYLRTLQNRGIPVVLCSGKANFAMKKIIKMSDLDNLHITDAGAVIIDPLDNKIVDKNAIDKAVLQKMFAAGKGKNFYWEMYTLDDWYADTSVNEKFFRIHSNTMGVPTKDEKDLSRIFKNYPVIKSMVLYEAAREQSLKKALAPFAKDLSLQWSSWPMLEPDRCVIITARNVSKRSAVKKVAAYYKIPVAEMLGVGDTIMDWNFVELCGYVGAMGNASQEFKDKVQSRPEDRRFIGPAVNDDGIIAIIEHFKPQINFQK